MTRTADGIPSAEIDREVTAEDVIMGTILFARMAKAIADTGRVAQFEIVVCDNDCKVYIRTTWGTEINTYQLRESWWLAVTEALDALDEVKPDVSTSEKE